MTKRRAAAAATRQRIVEATLAVHGEQGIAAARLEDIAARAGVSLATLYRHFSDYEQLVSACGQLTFERIPPPTAEDASGMLDRAGSREQRIVLLIDRVFGFYEMTGPMVEMMRHDAAALPVLAAAVETLDAGIDAWVATALPDESADVRRTVRALVDHRTWTALTETGMRDVRGIARRLIDATVR